MNWNDYSHLLLEKCKKAEVPYHAVFELTPFCNFRCNMCYIRLDPKQALAFGKPLSTEQWIMLGEAAKKMGTISMELTGGEALTRSDFPRMYRHYSNLGFLIILRTNGYSIDDNILNLFTERKPYKISITLYGATDETYQKVCGVSDGFSVVSKNILALKKRGLRVRLTTTITKENAHEIKLMKQWAEENGFSLMICGMLFKPMRGAQREVDHLRISVPEKEYELPEEIQQIESEIPNKDYYMNPFWMCRSFGAKFTVTWDGKLTICNLLPAIWTDPFESSLDSAYHKLYRDYRRFKRPAECKDCKFLDCCFACPAMFYSSTGSVNTITDEICKRARRIYKDKYLNGVQDKKNISDCYEDICE